MDNNEKPQNCANRGLQSNNKTGLKGVSWHKPTKNWRAQAKASGMQIHLGCYKTQEAAALAYDLFAVLNFGEFARTNFIGRNTLPVGDTLSPRQLR